jgi:hypothetical protein
MDLIIHLHYLHSLINDIRLVFYDDTRPINYALNRKGRSFVVMVPLQVTCQHMDESEFKLDG